MSSPHVLLTTDQVGGVRDFCSTLRDALVTQPTSLREAALGLGATRFEALWKVMLPGTRKTLIGATFLALGRALGETMAVLMVSGNALALGVESAFAPSAAGAEVASGVALARGWPASVRTTTSALPGVACGASVLLKSVSAIEQPKSASVQTSAASSRMPCRTRLWSWIVGVPFKTY